MDILSIIHENLQEEDQHDEKRAAIAFIAAMIMSVSLTACQKADDGKGTVPDAEHHNTEKTTPDENLNAIAQNPADDEEEHNDTEKTESDEGLASDEELDSDVKIDVVEPDPADDDWYMKGNIYTDENGNRAEVFFDDYGTIEVAVNGLSLYYTSADKVQLENNWRGYPCDDGTGIVYYPGEPAHLEISDGEYAGLYEAGGDKVK